ncbi:MAG: ribonuclease HII [Actinobacteria bacterium]|nr:ribonuclease HII [Actinomycetota bacterium]
MTAAPTLDEEYSLFEQGIQFVAGVDEVGRGALAGPVSVGIAVVGAQTQSPPAGLRDSKQMSLIARENIIDAVKAWPVSCAVGSASAQEIDQIGIVNSLRLAWARAYELLAVKPDHVILDGKHNWLSPKDEDLFGIAIPRIEVPVTMKIKADTTCASVSAASVLAKVERDSYMRELASSFPEYGWDSNVGYGASGHMDAIRKLGATQFHRKSWSLPAQVGV